MIRALIASLGLGLLFVACDSGGPVAPEQLVVEAFIEAAPETPRVIVRRSGIPGEAYSPEQAFVDEATVQVQTGEGVTALVPATQGAYTSTAALRERSAFTVEVQINGQRALGTGLIPPKIALGGIAVSVPEVPVEAVLLEGFDLDSLGVTIDEGFIYPIEVSMWWARPQDYTPADSSYWVQARLAPVVEFSSTVLDFFLLAEEVFQEQVAWQPAAQRYEWTGVYAILVDALTTPLPTHQLDIGLLRSTEDYARFARTRADRDRREPLSNVVGGLGIVAGVAIDSMQVKVPLASAAFR